MNVITVDGTGGVGKGTLAIRLADFFNFAYLDSGSLYRSLAYWQIQHKYSLTEMYAVIPTLNFHIEQASIYVNDIELTNLIRTEIVSQNASKLAKDPTIRSALLDLQRSFGKKYDLVTDGRDMGTVVFPGARVKFFLEASTAVRAERRYQQLLAKGETCNKEEIFRQLEERDYRDKHREVAPLVPAQDAVIIDTSNLTADEVFLQAKKIILNKGITINNK